MQIFCNRGVWELPQVVAEVLKSGRAECLWLTNNEIGDWGAEVPLLCLPVQ